MAAVVLAIVLIGAGTSTGVLLSRNTTSPSTTAPSRTQAPPTTQSPSNAQPPSTTPATSPTNATTAQFSDQALGLLDQSTSSFQTINTLFGEMQTVANGGYSSLTLAQAEQQLNAVIASRTSLAATAQGLNAPTSQAQAVRAALVSAFNASLTNDSDIANCLNEDNNGTVAYIFQGCLSASSASSDQATAAKQNFLNVYNQLRAGLGQAPVNIQF